MLPTLVLVRHGESEWNLAKRFTGQSDVALTELGRKQAAIAGELLAKTGLQFTRAYCSKLKRAKHSLDIILKNIDQENISIVESFALNERDFGDLTGLHHQQVRDEYNDKMVTTWRQSYDVAPPNGESLKQVAARIIPYWQQEILPRYLAGENIIIAAHNVSLKALMMHIEQISKLNIEKINLQNAEPIFYKLDKNGFAFAG